MDEVAIPSSNKRVSERWGASGSEAVGTGVWLLSGEAALTLLLVMPRPTAPAPATCCKVGLAPYYPPSAGVESHYPFVRCPKPYHRRTVGCSIATRSGLPPLSRSSERSPLFRLDIRTCQKISRGTVRCRPTHHRTPGKVRALLALSQRSALGQARPFGSVLARVPSQPEMTHGD